MEYATVGTLVRLRARELHHLRPLVRFVGNELAKVGRRTWNSIDPHVGETSRHGRIGKSCVDFPVKAVDDLSRHPSGRSDAFPGACFIAWDELVYCGDFWQFV